MNCVILVILESTQALILAVIPMEYEIRLAKSANTFADVCRYWRIVWSFSASEEIRSSSYFISGERKNVALSTIESNRINRQRIMSACIMSNGPIPNSYPHHPANHSRVPSSTLKLLFTFYFICLIPHDSITLTNFFSRIRIRKKYIFYENSKRANIRNIA